MTSTEKAREQRLAHSGRGYYKAWSEWCEAKGQEPSPECLKAWDEKHNGGKIRALFGTRDDVYQVGLITLYRRFLYKYAWVTVTPGAKGKAVSLSSIRKTPNGMRFMGASDQDEIDEMREKLQARVVSDTRRAHFLGLPWKEIRRLVEDALTLAENEPLAEMGVAAS